MKKFSIHLVDDQPKFKEQVQFALFPDGSCDELIDFQYFQSVGDAIGYYEKEYHFPHIVLIDINFSDLPDTFSDIERNKLRGLDLIQYIVGKSDQMVVFAFTGFAHEDEVGEALNKLGILENTIDKGKAVGAQVRLRVQNILKKRAVEVLKNLPQNYRNELTNLPIDLDRLEVGTTGFTLPCLLSGWGDIRNLPLESVQVIIDDLLRDVQATTFIGNWNRPNSPEQNALYLYKNLPRTKYEQKLKDINKKAFNLMLELIRINTQYLEREDDNFTAALSHDFQGFSTTKVLHNEEEIFFEKLIGRRAMLAIDTYINRHWGLDLEEFAWLLRDRILNMSQIDNAKNPQTAVFNTNLGIGIGKNGLLNTQEIYLLPEERDFLLNFGSLGEAFANFLELIVIPNILRPHLQGNELQNMSALNRFVTHISQGTHPPELIRNFLDNIFNAPQLINIEINRRREIFHLYNIPV